MFQTYFYDNCGNIRLFYIISKNVRFFNVPNLYDNYLDSVFFHNRQIPYSRFYFESYYDLLLIISSFSIHPINNEEVGLCFFYIF